MPVAFDTISILHRLEDAGLSRDAAEAIAAASLEAVEVARDGALADRDALATKADLSALKADLSALKADMSATKADVSALKADLSALKAELVDRIQATERRTYAAVFAAAGVLFAALKLIP